VVNLYPTGGAQLYRATGAPIPYRTVQYRAVPVAEKLKLVLGKIYFHSFSKTPILTHKNYSLDHLDKMLKFAHEFAQCSKFALHPLNCVGYALGV